jgi:precorrin-6Y C5,15-methyltransferase (decarboxylating)
VPEPGSIDLVGMHGGECFGAAAVAALARADVIVGARRHLDRLPERAATRKVVLDRDLDAALCSVEEWSRSGQAICVVASGDPGFFGLTRLATARLGARTVRVHPAPSSVALAAARLGLSWDDALVVSAHGRPLGPAADAVERHPKVVVMTAPDAPPEELGRLLLDRKVDRRVAVLSRIAEEDEMVWEGDIAGLAAGRYDGLSVVVCRAGDTQGPGHSWGLPDEQFEHRRGMITKAEVRAVALGKLALPPAGVLWDVGAGSGAVAAECARLAPGLRVYAVEKDAGLLRANVEGRAVSALSAVSVVEGEAPAALDSLPDPDRAFVGGGGLAVLDAVLARLRPGGAIVATFASPARAAEAYERLGHMVQMSISRATRMPGDGGMRLAAENPVFVCWGPAE